MPLDIEKKIAQLEKENQELYDDKEKFYSYVLNSPDILYEFSSTRGALFWSENVKNILGYTPDDLLKNPFIWTNSIHSDDIEEVTMAIKEDKFGKKFNMQYRIKNKSGNWIWLHDQFISKKKIGNEIIIIGHAADITEQKEFDQKLKESEERFKRLFQDSKMIMLLVNPKTQKIVDANKEAYNFYGHDELKLVHLKDITQTSIDKIIEKASLRDKTKPLECFHKIANGEKRIVESYPTLLKFKNENLLHIAIIDITEKINAEKAYRERLNEIDIISSNIQNIFWKADVTADNQLVNPYISDVAEKMLNLPPGTINNSWDKYFQYAKPEYLPKMMEVIQNGIMNIGKKYSLDYQVVKGNGELAWFSSSGKVIIEDGIKKIFGVTIDVTERVEREQKLNELNNTKDKLFSIIAHDLRSPFSAILGLTDILTEKVSEKDYSGLEKITSTLNKAAKQSFELLNNLLQWSRIQTDRIKFTPIDVDITKTINHVLDLLDGNISNKDIKIIKSFNQETKVLADLQMLETIIRNLLSNAIKYTPIDGQINISTQNNGACISIIVSDNGVGMSKETLESLFNLENNITTNGTEGEKGSGLGLILCKEFVEKHNGKIWVESKQNIGTKFTVELPLN